VSEASELTVAFHILPVTINLCFIGYQLTTGVFPVVSLTFF